MQNSRFKGLINRVKRKLLANLLLARTLLLAIGIGALVLLGLISFKIVSPLSPYLFGQNLVSSHNRTNILLLGMRGESPEGPDMTDTMIYASIKHSDGQISLITIPRDLWSDVIRAKINFAYHLGFVKESTEGGLLLAKTAVSEISGTPVHYAIVVDFTLFIKFIDALGGVDMDIPKTFDDYKFPIPGKENDLCDGDPQTLCRYEHLHFESGIQHMNGDTVLKYVRSRQSADLTEGTDFARSKRQEQLISAIKSKLLLQSPQKYLELFHLVKSSIITDLTPQNYLPLGKIMLKSRKLPLQSFSINQDNLLDNPPLLEKYNNQWVLIPKGNNSELIPDFFQQSLP